MQASQFIADETENGQPVVLDLRQEPARVIPCRSIGQAERIADLLGEEFSRASSQSEKADPWAPGGMYDTSTVTLADRTRCFVGGHDVHSWGTICGWCRRCKHSVWTYNGKSVIYHGEYHRFPPAHV